MSAAATQVTRRARRFVVASPVFFVAATLAILADAGPRQVVPLLLHGFVFSMVFGKAYALIPSYFDTRLEPRVAPTIQFPGTVLGAVALAASHVPSASPWVGTIGALLWSGGTVLFVATITWTIRGNLTGAATGTSQANDARARLDRIANTGLPVVLAYLLAGSYTVLATRTRLPDLGVGTPGGTHLLAAGGATLLVFVIGFRLFPRFLVTTPPRGLAPLVLVTGAIAPVVLATSLYGDSLFQIGAALQATAVTGFAVAYVALFIRSDRDRIGLYGPLLGVGFGVIGVGLGVQFAFTEVSLPLIDAHRRLNLIGWLGLTIIGATYQFYPPAVGTLPGIGDRLAVASMIGIAGGLLVHLLAVAVSTPDLAIVGEFTILGGAIAYTYIIEGLLYQRRT